MKTRLLMLAAMLAVTVAHAQSVKAPPSARPQKGVVPQPWVLFLPEWDASTDGGSGRIYTLPYAFSLGDITDLSGFATKLKKGSNPVASHLAARFLKAAQKHLQDYAGGTDINNHMTVSLIQELNRHIQDPSLYSASAWSGVKLSDETRELLKTQPQGAAMLRLNRLLIEDAFPQEIARHANGSIEGRVPDVQLGMCVAIEQPAVAFMGTDPDRIHSYRAVPEVGPSGSTFKFIGLKTGKYDLVLIDRQRNCWEGLTLGEDTFAKFPETSRTNLAARIAVSDGYFNRRTIHRVGIDSETTPARAIVFVERQRVGGILKQSGESFNGNQRRLEVIEFAQAADTWQYLRTRHLYRLGEPAEATPPFLKTRFVPELKGIRVVSSPKSLGALKLP